MWFVYIQIRTTRESVYPNSRPHFTVPHCLDLLALSRLVLGGPVRESRTRNSGPPCLMALPVAPSLLTSDRAGDWFSTPETAAPGALAQTPFLMQCAEAEREVPTLCTGFW